MFKSKLQFAGAITAIILAVSFFIVSNTFAATLSLGGAQTVAVSQTFSVDVMLDTKGSAVDGVDLYFLRFDPKILEVVDSNAGVSGVQIAAGTSLPLTLANSVNNSAGQIMFSQTASAGSTFSGTAKLATITFKAKAAGTSNISFDHKAGSTTDTNVASKGADALTAVSNTKITVSEDATEPDEEDFPPEFIPDDPPEDFVPNQPGNTTANSNDEDRDNGTSPFVWLGLGIAFVIVGWLIKKWIKK